MYEKQISPRAPQPALHLLSEESIGISSCGWFAEDHPLKSLAITGYPPEPALI